MTLRRDVCADCRAFAQSCPCLDGQGAKKALLRGSAPGRARCPAGRAGRSTLLASGAGPLAGKAPREGHWEDESLAPVSFRPLDALPGGFLRGRLQASAARRPNTFAGRVGRRSRRMDRGCAGPRGAPARGQRQFLRGLLERQRIPDDVSVSGGRRGANAGGGMERGASPSLVVQGRARAGTIRRALSRRDRGGGRGARSKWHLFDPRHAPGCLERDACGTPRRELSSLPRPGDRLGRRTGVGDLR